MGQDLTWREAIEKVLSETPGPMHYRAIADMIVRTGLRTKVGATPDMTVSRELTQSIIQEGTTCPFACTGRGLYVWRKEVATADEEEPKAIVRIGEEALAPTNKPSGEIMSTVITRPATLVKQGDLRLYATSLSARDLLTKGFYDIERLDPKNPEVGYQRLLNTGRAKKLANYLLSGQESRDAFLPTSLFLATDKNISFDPVTNTITFDIEQIGPFSVVDGQHRVEGLRLAAEKNPELLAFEVPVNIAVNLSKVAQMCHFLIVNTTQKSVDKAVEQRIYARLTSVLEVEDVPLLPKWIDRIVESGDDEQALRLVDYLNETSDSPWYGKIQMANADSDTATVQQKTFVKAIKRYVLTANNPISILDPDKARKIFLNYWKAIASLLDNGQPTVLFKYNGVDLFCRFSTPMFNKLQSINDFTVATIERLLRDVFESLDGDAAPVGHPDWWLSGTGPAGGLNSTALGKILHEFTKALHKTQGRADIQL